MGISAQIQNGHLIACQKTSRLSQPVPTVHDLNLCQCIAVPTDNAYKENIQHDDKNYKCDDVFRT